MGSAGEAITFTASNERWALLLILRKILEVGDGLQTTSFLFHRFLICLLPFRRKAHLFPSTDCESRFRWHGQDMDPGGQTDDCWKPQLGHVGRDD